MFKTLEKSERDIRVNVDFPVNPTGTTTNGTSVVGTQRREILFQSYTLQEARAEVEGRVQIVGPISRYVLNSMPKF